MHLIIILFVYFFHVVKCKQYHLLMTTVDNKIFNLAVYLKTISVLKRTEESNMTTPDNTQSLFGEELDTPY